MEEGWRTKRLQAFFEAFPTVAVAFSGGVDSSLLLYAAWKYGARTRGYFVKTPFQPAFELRDARQVADMLGAEMSVLPLDVLADPAIAANGADRCYRCKQRIVAAITGQAGLDGFPLVVDGSNASDDPAVRPGMRALAEAGVRSPLRECGIVKSEVRRLAREAGLFTWNKPAYACLATRVSTGTPIDGDMLANVEQAEGLLGERGFADFRVRLFAGAARLQFREEQIETAVRRRHEIVSALTPFFSGILLDLDERRGED